MPGADTSGWSVERRRSDGTGTRTPTFFRTASSRASGRGVVLLTAQDGPGAAFYSRLGYRNDGVTRGADGGQWLRFSRDLQPREG